jgi:uncharacterized membrane protein (UPF0127 family)
VADRPRDRARGLIGAGALAADEALFIPDATSVHTFGMAFAILVARLDASLRIVDLRRMPPRRLALPMRRARHVLEGPVGLDLRVGDVLREGQTGQPPRPAAPVTTQEPACSSSARLTPSASPGKACA